MLLLYALVFFTLLLEPFDFHRPDGIESFVPEEFSDRGDSLPAMGSGFPESLGHGLFLIPLAPLLAWGAGLRSRQLAGGRVLAIVLGICISSEALQAFVSRDVSVLDLGLDFLGYGLGVAAVSWHERSAAFQRGVHALGATIPLAAALAAFVAGGFLLVLPIELLPFRKSALASWEGHYPLTVGNERLGTRPWSGRVYRLSLFRRALPPAEIRSWSEDPPPEPGADPSPDPTLVAWYRFRPDELTIDSEGDVTEIRGARGPDLKARRSHIRLVPGGGILLRGQSLIRGFGPSCVEVIRAIRRTGELTILVDFLPLAEYAEDSGTIVSSACCERDFNVALAQEGAAVVLRLRTRFDGESAGAGSYPMTAELTGGRRTVLAATYRDGTIRFFQDGHATGSVRDSLLKWFSRRVFKSELSGRVAAGMSLVAWAAGFVLLMLLFEVSDLAPSRRVTAAATASFTILLFFHMVAYVGGR